MITVSPAEPRDAAAIAALLEDLGRFYSAAGSEPLDQRVDQISEAIFTSPPAAYALLARDGSTVAGIAAYSFLWPAVGATRSLYLKELYVAGGYRRRGVGELLMRAVFETAGALGCSRVEWTTDAGNTAARAFYARLGLPEYPSKVFYRVEDPGKAVRSGGRRAGQGCLLRVTWALLDAGALGQMSAAAELTERLAAVGAGVAEAPLGCFADALADLDRPPDRADALASCCDVARHDLYPRPATRSASARSRHARIATTFPCRSVRTRKFRSSACRARCRSMPGVRTTTMTLSPLEASSETSERRPRSACPSNAHRSSWRPWQVCGSGSSRLGSR